MKFRYFKLKGESLDVYLASEREEMRQKTVRHDALLKDRDDIQSFRPARNGGVQSVVFKDGRQPPGMVRASRSGSETEVRPSARGKESKEFRDFLASLKVTEDCQNVIVRRLQASTFVPGANSASRSGFAAYNSRVGHVGPDVYAEVPVGDSDGSRDQFDGHPDLTEVKVWEFVKACEDEKDYEQPERCYVLPSRV